MTVFQGKLFFTAFESTGGTELWTSDGTAAGTVQVKDIYPGASSGSPAYLTPFGNQLLFSATDSTATTGLGRELYTTDGTGAGTVVLKDIFSGTSSSSPTNLRSANGRVWFYANDGLGAGSELWVSDGTLAGTKFVFDCYPGTGAGAPNNFTGIAGGKVVFDAFDGTATVGSGREIWVTDGTGAGTLLLKDILPGTLSSSPFYHTELNGKCYFRAIDSAATGTEVWVTDGTPAGTVILKDINPGIPSGNTNPLVKIGNRIVICGDDGTTGFELWVTDGTAAGTVLVKDLRAGPLGALPWPYGTVGNRVLFSAFDDPFGEELFYGDHKQIGAGESEPFGVGCPGTGGLVPVLTTNIPVINTNFTLSLSNARATTPAVFVIGVGPTPLAVGGGCTLYMALTPVLAFNTMTDASGNASVTILLANDPNLLGFLAHGQTVVADPNGAWFNILAFSNAVKLVVSK
jgi:ELWxxDGT repeat protein